MLSDFHLLLIALVALLLFGNKLPSMMRKVGSGLSEFKRAMDDTREKVRKSIEESDKDESDKPPSG